MNINRRTTILTFVVVAAALVFVVAGLPYGQFQWSSALAAGYYDTTPTPSTVSAPPSQPAYLLNPQTAFAYTDSNGDLTSGRLYAVPLNIAGVGNSSVIARGLLAAAEFQVIGGSPFAPFPTPVRACVGAVGTPVFIPKVQFGTGVPTDLPQADTDRDGETCAIIYQPGTLAIVAS